MTSLDYKTLKPEETVNELRVLNTYELNIYHTVSLMVYPTRSISDKISNSTTRLRKEPKINFKVSKFAIFSRGPCLWNKHADRNFKKIALLFKAKPI